MVRLFQAIAVAALTILSVMSLDARLAAVQADYVNDCVKARGDIAIRACTRAIKSGRWKGRNLAWAYSNRGLAYQRKGEHDRAIADYDKAIKLQPEICHRLQRALLGLQ